MSMRLFHIPAVSLARADGGVFYVSTIALPSEWPMAEARLPEIVGGPDRLEGRLAGDRIRAAPDGDCAAACICHTGGAAQRGGNRAGAHARAAGRGVGGPCAAASPVARGRSR